MIKRLKQKTIKIIFSIHESIRRNISNKRPKMDQTNKIANPINNLSYDKTSAISIFEYSKGLLGRSLREFIKENYSPKKGKGSIGQMVENLYFLLETNNNPEADFSSAGMELKCTPLKLGKNDTYLIKERLVCNITTVQ